MGQDHEHVVLAAAKDGIVRVTKRPVGDVAQLALDVSHDPAGIALQLPQGLAHPLKLAGMRTAPYLAR